MINPISDRNYILNSVVRTDVNYTLLPNYNSWQTTWSEYLVSGRIDEQNYIHLFDFGIAQEYKIFYAKQMPPNNLQVIGSMDLSISVVWDSLSNHGQLSITNENNPAGRSFMIQVKRSEHGDKYYTVNRSFLPGHLSSFTVKGLAAGT